MVPFSFFFFIFCRLERSNTDEELSVSILDSGHACTLMFGKVPLCFQKSYHIHCCWNYSSGHLNYIFFVFVFVWFGFGFDFNIVNLQVQAQIPAASVHSCVCILLLLNLFSLN